MEVTINNQNFFYIRNLLLKWSENFNRKFSKIVGSLSQVLHSRSGGPIGGGGVGGATPPPIIENFYHFNQLKDQKTNMRKDLLTLFYTYRIKLTFSWTNYKVKSKCIRFAKNLQLHKHNEPKKSVMFSFSHMLWILSRLK